MKDTIAVLGALFALLLVLWVFDTYGGRIDVIMAASFFIGLIYGKWGMSI